MREPVPFPGFAFRSAWRQWRRNVHYNCVEFDGRLTCLANPRHSWEAVAMSNEKISRTVLPIPDRMHVGLTTYDAKDPDTKYPPIEQLRPPKGAPNIMIILLDDVGFGTTSAFGGPCHTPIIEKLASTGLKYTR